MDVEFGLYVYISRPDLEAVQGAQPGRPPNTTDL